MRGTKMNTTNDSSITSEQDSINQQEWNNPNNWSGHKLISLYFSKKDSRTFVPKQITWMGWTVNLGKAEGVYWLLGLFVALVLLGVFA